MLEGKLIARKKIQKFKGEILTIVADIIQIYKNFFSWNVSKIRSLIKSFAIGLFLSFPALVIMGIIMFIDPVNWIELLNSEGVTEILQNFDNIAWMILVAFFFVLACMLFFIGFGYYAIFLIQLYLGYIDNNSSEKSYLGVTKKSYFAFLRVSVLNFLCIFAPVFAWIIVGSLLNYILGPNFGSSLIVSVLLFIVIALVVYITYKVQFSYMILADRFLQGKETSFKAFDLIKRSISITKPKYFIKFVIIVFLYFLILLPFTSIDTYYENKITDISQTYNFRNDLYFDLTESDRQYLGFVASEYENISDEELLNSISVYYRLRIVHFVLSYFLFGGLILLIATSFYRHILLKNHTVHK